MAFFLSFSIQAESNKSETSNEFSFLEMQRSQKALHKLRVLVCNAAYNNDFKTFIRHINKIGIELSNANIYKVATCRKGNLILHNTLQNKSALFVRDFVLTFYKKFGKEELIKIINMPGGANGLNVLEEAIQRNSCRNIPDSDLSRIIKYLQIAGGKTRSNFTIAKLDCESYGRTVNEMVDEIPCENPVDIFNSEKREIAKGYLISFTKNTDVDLLSQEYLKKYQDLKIHTIINSDLKIIRAESGDITLQKIQCESKVTSIENNLPLTIN